MKTWKLSQNRDGQLTNSSKNLSLYPKMYIWILEYIEKPQIQIQMTYIET